MKYLCAAFLCISLKRLQPAALLLYEYSTIQKFYIILQLRSGFSMG